MIGGNGEEDEGFPARALETAPEAGALPNQNKTSQNCNEFTIFLS
jgi:hypothetical protein